MYESASFSGTHCNFNKRKIYEITFCLIIGLKPLEIKVKRNDETHIIQYDISCQKRISVYNVLMNSLQDYFHIDEKQAMEIIKKNFGDKFNKELLEKTVINQEYCSKNLNNFCVDGDIKTEEEYQNYLKQLNNQKQKNIILQNKKEKDDFCFSRLSNCCCCCCCK